MRSWRTLPAPLVLELTSYHNYSGTRRVFSFLPFIGTEERTIKLTGVDKELKNRMYREFVSQRPVLELDYERFCTIITGAQWRRNAGRSEARRGGRECRSRCAPDH